MSWRLIDWGVGCSDTHVLCGFAWSAQAAIDFEGFSEGDIITNQIPGVTISATGGTGDAMLYNTNEDGEDPDLRAPFFKEVTTGAESYPGLVLIIQEPLADNPDDNAPGGSLRLDFATAITALSMDVFDMDPGSEIKLFNSVGGTLGTYGLLDTDTNSAPNLYQHVVFAGTAGVANVSAIEVSLSKSGAIDNIAYVPLPAAAWLFGTGLVAPAGVARRRS